MMRSQFRVLLLVLPFALVAVAQGQREAGYTMLFDGTDLTGWRYGKGEVLHKSTETADKRFYVSNGAIVAAAKDKDGGKAVQSLWTVREFAKDFVLKLEFKAAQEAQGAVVVRNHAFAVADFIRRGDGKPKFKTDDWNELEITVKLYGSVNGRALTGADRVEVEFNNGKPVAKVNGQEVTSVPFNVSIAIAASARLNGQGHGGHPHVPAKGFVALRTGNLKMEYRNIRFRELQ